MTFQQRNTMVDESKRVFGEKHISGIMNENPGVPTTLLISRCRRSWSQLTQNISIKCNLCWPRKF